MTRPYDPSPGSVPARVLAYLRELTPGREVSSKGLGRACDFDPRQCAGFLGAALKAGALTHRRSAGGRDMLWRLGDGVRVPVPLPELAPPVRSAALPAPSAPPSAPPPAAAPAPRPARVRPPPLDPQPCPYTYTAFWPGTPGGYVAVLADEIVGSRRGRVDMNAAAARSRQTALARGHTGTIVGLSGASARGDVSKAVVR